MEIFLNRLHRFDMLDRRCMRPTPGHLAHIPSIYIILDATTNLLAVSWTETTPLCYWLHVLCGGGDENHHRYCGGQTSLSAEYRAADRTIVFSVKKWSRTYIVTLECRHLVV